MRVRTNCMIQVVLRPGAADAYGTPKPVTVYENVPARLEQRSSMVRTQRGDFISIDAYLQISAAYQIEPGDALQIDLPGGVAYNVFDCNPVHSVAGEVMFLTCRLVLRRTG